MYACSWGSAPDSVLEGPWSGTPVGSGAEPQPPAPPSGYATADQEEREAFQIRVGLEALVLEPDNFVGFSKAILERVESSQCDDFVLEKVVKDIVEMVRNENMLNVRVERV